MPVKSQSVKKKHTEVDVINQQEALDFAQLILDIFKDKKQV